MCTNLFILKINEYRGKAFFHSDTIITLGFCIQHSVVKIQINIFLFINVFIFN